MLYGSLLNLSNQALELGSLCSTSAHLRHPLETDATLCSLPTHRQLFTFSGVTSNSDVCFSVFFCLVFTVKVRLPSNCLFLRRLDLFYGDDPDSDSHSRPLPWREGCIFLSLFEAWAHV